LKSWVGLVVVIMLAACSPAPSVVVSRSPSPIPSTGSPSSVVPASPTISPTSGSGPWKVLASSDTAGAGWSPDGRWLLVWDAVTNGTAAQRHISLDDAHGNVIRTFQGELPVELEPVWLDDRSFVIARDGKNYLGTVDSPALRPISPQFSAGVVSNGHDALAFETSANLDASARFVVWTVAGATTTPRSGVPIAWSGDGTKLAIWHWSSGSGPGAVGWVETVSWPGLRSLGAIRQPTSGVSALFDPSGQYLYASGFLLDLESGQVASWSGPSPSGQSTDRLHVLLFPAVAAVTDPDEAASASADGSTVVLWHMSTQQPVVLQQGLTERAIDVPGPLQLPDSQLSPDGSHLVISCVASAVGGNIEALLLVP
jgi:hypothetical protein